MELLPGTLDLLILRALVLEPNHGLGISRRIDQVLADPEIAREQRSIAAGYRRIRPRQGTEW